MPNQTPTIGGNNYNLNNENFNPQNNSNQFVPENQNYQPNSGQNQQYPSQDYNNFQPNSGQNFTPNSFDNSQNNSNKPSQLQDYSTPNSPNFSQDYNTVNPNFSQDYQTNNTIDPNLPPNTTVPQTYNSQVLPNQQTNQQAFVQTPAIESTTFQEKHGGNKLFFIIAGIVVLGLLLAAGWLAYYSFNQNNLTSSNPLTASNSNSNLPASSNSNNSITNISKSDQNNSVKSTNSTFGINFSGNSTPSFGSSGNISSNNSIKANNSDSNQSILTANSIPNSGQNPQQTMQNETPSQKARKNSDTIIPAVWLTQKFGSSYVSSGVCQNIATCGDGADSDNDGLTNLQEYNYGTDPINNDADGDGIADGDEVNIYYTDPTKKDSDGDGYDDNLELTTCYDPIIQANAKMSIIRLGEITKNVQLNPLHKPTITILGRAGATSTDLQNGFIQNTCTPQNSNPTKNNNSNTDLNPNVDIPPNNQNNNPNVSF